MIYRVEKLPEDQVVFLLVRTCESGTRRLMHYDLCLFCKLRNQPDTSIVFEQRENPDDNNMEIEIFETCVNYTYLHISRNLFSRYYFLFYKSNLLFKKISFSQKEI